MVLTAKQPVIDFCTYPPIGSDDWRYTYETAVVRTIQMHMLSRATLLDMANAQNFEQAVDLLSSTEYAMNADKSLAELENILRSRRSAARELFTKMMLDKPIVELFKTRDDFANIRLAVKREVTEKPIGKDYSSEGNFNPSRFEEVFEQENYELLPDYMTQAAEQAMLDYYQDKNIRRIDFAIDRVQAEYNLKKAAQLKDIFLLSLFRIQIDLTNIRTMLRLKFTDSELRNVFLEGGFIELERLRHALDVGYETQGSLFFVLPYHKIVEAGAAYLASEKSFLGIEKQCEEYLNGFLRTAITMTIGPQPIIAYLLLKEDEIRKIRLILTAKKNSLDIKLVLDRIS